MSQSVTSFAEKLATFEQFLEDEGLGLLAVNQCEVNLRQSHRACRCVGKGMIS